MSLGIAVLLFFVMLFIGTPIAVCLAGTGIAWLLADPTLPNVIFASKIYGATDSFAYMAIPFFMMAGQIMEQTGITEKFIAFAKSIIGHIRGGVAHTATMAGVIMAGVSGSGNADTTAIGSLMIPALVDDGYEEGFAVSVVAAAGSLGPIIPPSVMMIVFSNAAGYDVGKVFMGGVVPGVLMALGFMLIAWNYARKHNIGGGKFGGWKNVGKTFLQTVGALVMPIIIIVGIVAGVFTATEAGVVACVYGIIYGIVVRKLTVKGFLQGLADSCVANISSEWMFLLFVLIVCTIAGCFIDGMATMLMLLPVLTPVVTLLGIDFQHFALVYVMGLLTCQITPPVGNLIYVAASIEKTPVKKVIKAILPFCVVMILVIFMCIFIPQLVTWLPNLIYG